MTSKTDEIIEKKMKKLTQEQREIIEDKLMNISYKIALLRDKERKLKKKLEVY